MALNRLIFQYKYKEEFLQDQTIMTRQLNGTVYKVDRPNSSGYRRSVSYIGRKAWNERPSYLRAVHDYECLKTLLKGHYRPKNQTTKVYYVSSSMVLSHLFLQDCGNRHLIICFIMFHHHLFLLFCECYIHMFISFIDGTML